MQNVNHKSFILHCVYLNKQTKKNEQTKQNCSPAEFGRILGGPGT